MIEYEKKTWINDQTKLNADNLNHLEDGVRGVYENTVELDTKIDNEIISVKKTITENDEKNTAAVTELKKELDSKFDGMESIEQVAKEVVTVGGLVNGVKLYNSLDEVSATESTGLLTIFYAMTTPSRLVCNIVSGDTSIYPATTGTLTINKTSTETGEATFIYGDGRIATAAFLSNASSGGGNL